MLPGPKRGSAASCAFSFARSAATRELFPPSTTISSRVGGLGREGSLEREVALFRGQVVRQGGDAAGADVEAEDGDGQREHQPGAEDEAQDGAAQDGLDDRAPEAALGAVGAAEVAAENRHAHAVDAVAEQAEQGRQQRQRGGDRDDADDDRAGGEAAHDRRRHEQHPEQGDHERAAAEEHRPARCRAGEADRVRLLEPSRPFLAEARDDEERVVDPERESHPGEHVHDEHREAELEREQGDEAEADQDREDRHQHRHQARDHSAENEEEHDQRGREPELELAVLEVALGQRVEVVCDRVVARDRDCEAGRTACLLYERQHRFDRRIALHGELNQGRVPVARDERPVAGEVAARADHLAGGTELPDEARDEAPELRAFDPVADGADDHDVAHLPFEVGRRRGERGRDRIRGLRRLRRADNVGVRGQPVQRGRHQHQRDHHRHCPGRKRPPRMRGARPRKPLRDPPHHEPKRMPR